MTNIDFVNTLIGKDVTLNGDGDLGIHGELRPLIYNNIKLRLIRITKKGKVEVEDSDGNLYYVPIKNISEYEMD